MNLEPVRLEINHLHIDHVSWTLGITLSVSEIAPAITPERIVHAVAYHADMTVSELMSDCRESAVARRRQIAMLLMRQACPRMSFPDIAREFRKDHTTILHGIKRAREAVRVDDALRYLYHSCCQSLNIEPLRVLNSETAMKWTEDEDDILRRAWADGKLCREIGPMVGRTAKAVAGRARHLGLPKRQNHAEGAEKALGGVVPLASMTPYAEPERPQNGCQWPHGDPREPGFHMCGAPIMRGGRSPYCAEHMRLAWREAS